MADARPKLRLSPPEALTRLVILALTHTASATLRAGHGTADEIESALLSTVLGAAGARDDTFRATWHPRCS